MPSSNMSPAEAVGSDRHRTPKRLNAAKLVCDRLAARVRLALVNLEESSNEKLGDRCEECGAKLTPQELQAAMESGGPALCSIHAAEDEPGLAADEAGFLENS